MLHLQRLHLKLFSNYPRFIRKVSLCMPIILLLQLSKYHYWLWLIMKIFHWSFFFVCGFFVCLFVCFLTGMHNRKDLHFFSKKTFWDSFRDDMLAYQWHQPAPSWWLGFLTLEHIFLIRVSRCLSGTYIHVIKVVQDQLWHVCISPLQIFSIQLQP